VSMVTKVGAAYLWQAASSPAMIALRGRAWSLLGLGPGMRVLDIGCGPGTTIFGLASLVGPLGLVAGVDHDPEMVRQAEAVALRLGVCSWARHQVADATALPFPAGVFDACYSERLLQHLDPARVAVAAAEAVRVLRPGGAAVFVDTDWASFSVDAGENELERRLQGHHLARFRNPFAARELGRTLRAAGLGFVFTEPFAVPLSAGSVADLLAGAEQDAADCGALTAMERTRWKAALAVLRGTHGVAGHLTMVIAAGRRL
jgi:SAM-dependent methyltransferase